MCELVCISRKEKRVICVILMELKETIEVLEGKPLKSRNNVPVVSNRLLMKHTNYSTR